MKIVECVPNFSEGRDAVLIEEIVSAAKTAKVLDVHSDPDHNRSVVTILGDPKGVKQSAFDLTERAMQLLDLKNHAGVHPFIGVVDVIPFIPISDIDINETCQLAHSLGNDLWDKLKFPVYFYGDAAKIDERKELPYVRKGGYAALKNEIESPHRRPDVGHGLHVTSGAVAVGVRDYLIAFNVNLDSRDIDIAKSIASNIREKSGGLPGIRALGMELPSKECVQVSINVTDHRTTSLKKVFTQVKKWAKEYKVLITGSELVGMIPKAAVFDGMNEYLKLPAFHDDMILEKNLPA
ncbi:MAG: glutamate formimidoyltransferase [Candidatus Margulisiibacteriota bacterium]|nr:glutamate formimidoyltransferase [Candidatus Margulisiibacteriota bacterium]